MREHGLSVHGDRKGSELVRVACACVPHCVPCLRRKKAGMRTDNCNDGYQLLVTEQATKKRDAQLPVALRLREMRCCGGR